ncbi:hypothetical protein PUNSTDRAFT_118416 [Punctularia strigosozonata HHB-11173 SS5]|uniref:uncharacterized protein n=1 Tax=Punctularia strigosozonata (strain HHB-11173) TaxID=741275 RepID=UPI000441783A|nr:uncharacterized protein PUNSTDRAFT_118416 [Punctularia strigosozonata HHB-11173 SS5]EIN12686.1 hypothetical protein PUNSTDRAFT_118416 [Punctularia strigosozonata HHB-11173 SS5]
MNLRLRASPQSKGEAASSSSDHSDHEDGLCPRSDKDMPPDGTEEVMEWREGCHRIIERRKGPGDDVEVEIIRNFYGPSSAQKCMKLIHGASESVKKALRGEHVEGVATTYHKLPSGTPSDHEHVSPEPKYPWTKS